MRFMVIVKASEDSAAGKMPSEASRFVEIDPKRTSASLVTTRRAQW